MKNILRLMRGKRHKWRLSSSTKLSILVLLLMGVISVLISERVLSRLSNSQEEYLQGLSSTYLDGLSASVVPAVLRKDSWEIFDTLDRISPKNIRINLVEAIVTDAANVVLAANKPLQFPTLSQLSTEFRSRFVTNQAVLDVESNLGFRMRSIYHQGKEVGRIYATFDALPFLQERKNVFYTLLLTNAILTLFIAWIGFFAVRRMTAPMRVLEEHFLDAARGELKPISHAEFPKGQSDASRMYDAFNKLVESEKERSKLVLNLAREERLAGLGRLASGMAHEINNPLGGMLNAVDTLEKHGEKAATRQRSVNLIRRGLLSIRDIVKATLATYRPERDARDLIRQDFEDVALLLKQEIMKRNVDFFIDIPSGRETFPNIPAGPVRQAMLNLCLNAIAISQEGSDVKLKLVEDESYYILSVTDNGPGLDKVPRAIIEADQKNQVPDDLSGLGLWMVREICSELGATLSAEEVTRGGTKITLRLPISGKEVVQDAA